MIWCVCMRRDVALERMATGHEQKDHATVKLSVETGIFFFVVTYLGFYQ